MARKSSKESILDAADRVINRQGLACATIDAVAHEAGISKGGLFYHFSSKRDMLLQLVDRYERLFFLKRGEILETLPDSPAKLLKATVIASIHHSCRTNVNASNFLSLFDDVELRERICRIKRKIFQEIIEGARSPERVAIAILATDGLWVSEMFGRKSFNDDFKKRIVNELLKLIDVHEWEVGNIA